MPVFKRFRRSPQNVFTPSTFYYDKYSITPRVVMLGLLIFAVVTLLPTEVLAVTEDTYELKTQITSLHSLLKGIAQPLLFAVTIAAGSVGIYKQNVPGLAVAVIGGVSTYLLSTYITEKYALVL